MTKKRAKQIARMAMEFMRKRYAVGHFTYLNGGRWEFAVKDHKKFLELSEAIEVLGEKE